jgi:hypothetical protein
MSVAGYARPGGWGTRPYVVLFSPCVFFVRSGLEVVYLTTETLRHGEIGPCLFHFVSNGVVWFTQFFPAFTWLFSLHLLVFQPLCVLFG